MKISNIYKFVLIFCVVYFSLVALHESKAVRKVHAQVFIALEQIAFNIFNPVYRVDFMTYQRTPGVEYRPDLFDFSINIYDKKKWKRAPRKSSVSAISMLNGGIDTSSIGPILLLLALIIATPTNWKRKLIYIASGVFLVYILIAMKYSHMFYENLDNYPAEGMWGFLSSTLGKAFKSHEFMLMNVFFIWVVMTMRKKELDWLLK